jgi:PEP-CTERM motif
MRHLCRRKGMPMRGGLPVLGALLLAIQCHPARAALAISDLLFLRLTFGLASSDESVTPGPPASFCVPIGSGNCGKTGIQASFGLGETFGPTDPSKDLEIRVFGSALATSPPPAFSLYIDGITGSFDFTNYSPNPVDIDVNWNATYELTAHGAVSNASISAGYSEKDVATGDVLIPATLFFQDSQPNDGQKSVSPSGSLVVSIRPLSTTDLIIVDPQTALAAAIPEPASLALLGFGFLGLRLARRSDHSHWRVAAVDRARVCRLKQAAKS